ncbi:MAG: DNA polymerase III subunit delta [Planctomycetota bacterium]
MPPGKPRFGPHLRALILHGKEGYLRASYTERLQQAIEDAGLATDLVRFGGDPSTLADILDECRSPGLMVQHKIVVVDDADVLLKERKDDDTPAPPGARKPRKARELIEDYLENPSDTATLVLRAETWRPGRIDKRVAACGMTIKCEAERPDQLAAWAVGRAAEEYGATLQRNAARALVDRIGPDMGRIDTELAKLSCGTTDGTITPELVHDLVGFSREETAWIIQDAVMSRAHPEQILGKIRELLTVSRVPPLLCRFAFLDLATKLHVASRAAQAGRPKDVNFKLWGAGSAILAAGRHVRPDDAAALLRAAVDTDAAGKSGRGDEIIAVETLALRFIDVLRRAA